MLFKKKKAIFLGKELFSYVEGYFFSFLSRSVCFIFSFMSFKTNSFILFSVTLPALSN